VNSRMLKIMAVLATVAIVAVAVPASAGPLSNKLICVATGNVNVSTPDPAADDTVSWMVRGTGLCTGDSLGPHILRLRGVGTSTNLGLCDGLLVTDLAMDVTLRLESVSSGVENEIRQTWRAPITTFPVATPFFIDSDSGALAGVGAAFTRVAGRCPPHGSSGANIEFQFLKG
jgi:hypothetical protein